MRSRFLAILAASVLAVSMPLTADAGKGNGKGGDSPGRSGEASGHSGKGGSKDGAGVNSGHGRSDRDGKAAWSKDGSRKARAPDGERGLAKAKGKNRPKVDDVTTAGVGRTNFGLVISSIRAGKSSVIGISDETDLNIVDVSDLINGNNRVALENALADREDEIETLRDELADLDHPDLLDADIDDAVAVRRTADGSVTVFVDRD